METQCIKMHHRNIQHRKIRRSVCLMRSKRRMFVEHPAARAIWWFRYHERPVGVQDTSGMASYLISQRNVLPNQPQESPEEILWALLLSRRKLLPGTLRSCFLGKEVSFLRKDLRPWL